MQRLSSESDRAFPLLVTTLNFRENAELRREIAFPSAPSGQEVQVEYLSGQLPQTIIHAVVADSADPTTSTTMPVHPAPFRHIPMQQYGNALAPVQEESEGDSDGHAAKRMRTGSIAQTPQP